ncbi:MAG TPA: aspartate kinase [Gaiellaceae bacterium]|nr:aspartate kinase [Gaiellaceae bacterium]
MSATQYEAVPEVAADAAARGRDLVVMKFGGTSVGDTEKIKEVARRLVAAREAGFRVVGVLSAMGDTTDELIRLAHEISPKPQAREYDMLVSVGERISNALCAMAIYDLGHEAISLTGSQAGIVTDTVHGKAKIVEVRAQRVHDSLDDEKIVLVAGFQGVSSAHEVTTLGRGGSDTTAVALAAALGATACEIYTDVEGVFTADPRIVPGARKLAALTYEEMLELSASGAKVLSLRSVEFARNHDVRLHVRSTFSQADGTWVVDEEDPVLEKAIISGVAQTDCEPLFRVREIDAATLFARLAAASVNVDTILQTSMEEIVFSAPLEDRDACKQVLESLGVEWSMRDDLGKVSLVGVGMKSHPGIAAKTLATLGGIGVESQVISTSPIKIACHIRTEDVPKAVAALHEAFELERA